MEQVTLIRIGALQTILDPKMRVGSENSICGLETKGMGEVQKRMECSSRTTAEWLGSGASSIERLTAVLIEQILRKKLTRYVRT